MTDPLSPTQAANVAASAYLVRLVGDMQIVSETAQMTSIFDVPRGQRFVGESGFVGVKKVSGFGYVACGVGARRNECLVSVRGTVTGYDWVTDARMGAVAGPHGMPVHAGFWDATRAVLPKIKASLDRDQPETLHVVGHSLGGAMAGLIADALSGRYAVKLYTFASPRAGLAMQASAATRRLGEENVFRVYHDNDVVPMVPLWPYCHVPYDRNAYRLRGPGAVLSFPAHFMRKYIDSVQGASWGDLRHQVVHGLRPFEDARRWLEDAAALSGSGCLMGSAWVLDKLLWAFEKIIQTVLRLNSGMLGVLLLDGATALDALARLLHSGVLTSIDMAEQMGHWVVIALRWLGIQARQGVNLSVALIRYVLDRLHAVVGALVRRALEHLP